VLFRSNQIDQYRDLLPEFPKRGIPALDEEKKLCGLPNYNHPAYIFMGKEYLRDAKTTIRHYPGVYLHLVAFESFARYRLPASDWSFFRNDRIPVSVKNLAGYYSYLDLPLLLPGLALAIVWPLWLLNLRLRGKPGDGKMTAKLCYLCALIIYVTLTGTCIDFGENNRYRFLIDPLLLSLTVACCWQIMESIKYGKENSAD